MLNPSLLTRRVLEFGLLRQPVLILATVISLLYGFALSSDLSTLVLAVALGGVVLGSLALREPGNGAAILLVIAWGQISDVLIKFHGIPSLTKPLVALLALVLVIRRFGPRGQRIVFDATTWWLLAYLLVVVLGLWYAEYPGQVPGPAFDIAKDIVIFVVLVNQLSFKNTLIRGLWLVMICGAVYASLTVYQEVTRTYDDTYGGMARMKVAFIAEGLEDRPRAAGPLQDPNAYSQLLLVMVPLGLWGAINARTWPRRLAAAYVVAICISGCVLTFSRTGYLALTVVLFLFAVHVRLDARYLVLVPLIVAMFLNAPSEFRARFETLGELLPSNEEGTTDGSFRGRSAQLTAAIDMFADNPLLGVGQGNFRKLYPLYIRQNGSAVADEERDAHNLYLQVAAEHGIVGLTLLLGIMTMTLLRLRQARLLFERIGDQKMAELATMLRIAFVGYMVSSIFLHDAYPIFLWLQVALAATMFVIAQREAGQAVVPEARSPAPVRGGLTATS